ncbi:MAG: hypothetical protein K9J79_10690 [Desulfobacteraceae bacterium]|nr:hypothetical protein [Desulfobacteraceae bacterium]MCF8095812.1 hypothetical protein [Desulfobacteraceae bacterium]
METLIFLLVILFIIIINIARIQKKSRDSTRAEQEGGWKKNLKDLLAEMQGQTQPSLKEGQKRPSGHGRSAGWEDLMAAEEPYEEKPEPAAPAAEPPSPSQRKPGLAQRSRTLIESRSQEGWTPEARIGKTEKRAPAPPVAGPASKARGRSMRLQISRGELRRAIIWYEVVGPPMSLRDPEREMWL